MAAAGRRWQRCSSCGCRLMSASGQRPCSPSHGRGHHLPGRSTSIRALWRTAWLHESACWAVAVERWARRGATRRRKGLFHPFVRYLTHLDLEPAVGGPACRDENLVEKDKNPEEWWPWKLDPRNGHCATPSQWSRRKSREISGIVTENTRF